MVPAGGVTLAAVVGEGEPVLCHDCELESTARTAGLPET